MTGPGLSRRNPDRRSLDPPDLELANSDPAPPFPTREAAYEIYSIVSVTRWRLQVIKHQLQALRGRHLLRHHDQKHRRRTIASPVDRLSGIGPAAHGIRKRSRRVPTI